MFNLVAQWLCYWAFFLMDCAEALIDDDQS